MNFTRVGSRVTSQYICDPYSTLMHYRRTFKLLKIARNRKYQVLCLGNKNQFGIDWKNHFEGLEMAEGRCDESVIDSAAKHYSLIICVDPVLYAPYLRRVVLPVISIATAKELYEYPEILQVTDYLLPAPSNRRDAALRQMMLQEITQPQEETAPLAAPDQW
eukprot:GHVS01079235.1.p1 GENE.GHVS01079235.1~~GHVS01079235.1.p1  ORF type:complete len:162 (-),score=19.02 GHVS01079235.1:582-1067(-)